MDRHSNPEIGGVPDRAILEGELRGRFGSQVSEGDICCAVDVALRVLNRSCDRDLEPDGPAMAAHRFLRVAGDAGRMGIGADARIRVHELFPAGVLRADVGWGDVDADAGRLRTWLASLGPRFARDVTWNGTPMRLVFSQAGVDGFALMTTHVAGDALASTLLLAGVDEEAEIRRCEEVFALWEHVNLLPDHSAAAATALQVVPRPCAATFLHSALVTDPTIGAAVRAATRAMALTYISL